MKLVGPVLQSAAVGVRRAQAAFEKAAADGPRALLNDSVSVTGEATHDLPQTLQDMRVAKYAFVANLRVLETADQTAREMLKALKP